MKYLESLGWKHLPGGAWQHAATGRTFPDYEEALRYQQYDEGPGIVALIASLATAETPRSHTCDPPEPLSCPNLRPDYYKPGTYEARRVIRAWQLNHDMGAALKYICRAGAKPGVDAVTDLQKAVTYLGFEIDARKEKEAPTP